VATAAEQGTGRNSDSKYLSVHFSPEDLEGPVFFNGQVLLLPQDKLEVVIASLISVYNTVSCVRMWYPRSSFRTRRYGRISQPVAVLPLHPTHIHPLMDEALFKILIACSRYTTDSAPRTIVLFPRPNGLNTRNCLYVCMRCPLVYRSL